jgi:hypothetical protein
VTSVLTPEIVVKTIFPGPFELPEESPELEFCELGPERCTELFWEFPLDWEGDGPLVRVGFKGSDKLKPGESGLEVGVDESGDMLGCGFEVSVLPFPEFGEVVAPPPPPPPPLFPGPLPFPVSRVGVGVGCGGSCCGGDVVFGLLFPGAGVFFGPLTRGSTRGMEGSEIDRPRRPRRSKLLDASTLELELELELGFEKCLARRNGTSCILEVPRERERSKIGNQRAKIKGIYFLRRGKRVRKGREKVEKESGRLTSVRRDWRQLRWCGARMLLA